LTLALLDALVGLRRTGRARLAAAAGLATGLFVLTRATWYLFPVPCLLLVAVLAPARRVRAVLACLAPILVLQGGWAVKNYAVYGVLSPATSAWGGLHARAGLRSAGFEKEFDAFRREWVTAERGYPPWRVLAAKGDTFAMAWLPPELRDRDAQVERAFGLENPIYNTLTTRVIFAEDQRDFLDFARTHPGTMLRKWWKAYHVFWQPIANYGRMFVALFATSSRITNPFDAPEIVRQLLAGKLPDAQYVMSGSSPWNPEGPLPQPQRSTPTTLYTVRWIEPFALVLEMVGVHLLLPLVGVVWLAHRVRRGWSAAPIFDPLRMAALLVGATLYGYLAVLANLIETAENMRYRLEVEPVIWVVTVICVTELAGLLRARWRRADLVRVPRADHPADAALAGGDAFRAVTAVAVAR
jgi:hypothetical protein